MINRAIVLSATILVCWMARVDAQSPLFVSGSPVSFGRGIGSVKLLDLNRDGRVDLVVHPRESRNPEVRLGDGRGRFAPVAGTFNFDSVPGAIAFGDVNGDGIPDCGLTSRDATNEYVHVFLGSGDGRFRPTPTPRHIANQSGKLSKARLWFVDVNEDKKLDIVTQNARRNTVEILTGDGRGGFSPTTIVTL